MLFIYGVDNNKFDKVQRGVKPVFTPSGNWVAFAVKPQFDTVRKAKLDKVKKDMMPGDSLWLNLKKNKPFSH